MTYMLASIRWLIQRGYLNANVTPDPGQLRMGNRLDGRQAQGLHGDELLAAHPSVTGAAGSQSWSAGRLPADGAKRAADKNQQVTVLGALELTSGRWVYQ